MAIKSLGVCSGHSSIRGDAVLYRLTSSMDQQNIMSVTKVGGVMYYFQLSIGGL